MNKIAPTFIALSLIAGSAFIGGYAQAQNCSAGGGNARQDASEINALVAGKYVCAQFNGDKWDELHMASSNTSGQMQDYKLGPTDPRDPSKIVGTYEIHVNGNDGAQIRYTYGSDAYFYKVFKDRSSGNVSFCGVNGSTPQLAVTISAAHCY
jgi:hypothetical protein